MKELIDKHKEAIETFQEGAINQEGDFFGEYIWGTKFGKLSESCALITQKHGEIMRLEGMIEVYREMLDNDLNPFELIVSVDELDKQLKALKGE